MFSLIFIAFVGGFLTIAAPCILAVLPIILGTTIGHQNKLRPVAIVVGLTVSFTLFGVLFTYLTNLFGLSSNTLRTIALIFLGLFGFALIFPKIFEKFIFSLQSFFQKILPQKKFAQTDPEKKGLLSGFMVGASLGLVWVPCAGPILGAILTLAVTQTDLGKTILLMISYSLGAGLPMLLIAYGGNYIIGRLKFLKENGERINRIAGVVLILGVLFIATGLDIKIQTSLYNVFPSLGKFEESLLADNNELSPNPDSADQQSPSEINNISSMLIKKDIKAPELTGTQEWINSEPLKISELKDKVVIVDFWTYSCINCIRTLPYLNSWYKNYKDQGLVIIGVHTPEFAFEKEIENVKKAVKDHQIEYPVVQDNNYRTWGAYNNHYWPAKYIIDKNGYIRNTHFGEGNYEETEEIIRYLLAEGKELDQPMSKVDAEKVDFSQIETPETYLGYARAELQVNPEQVMPDKVQTFSEPQTLAPNRFYLLGSWFVGKEAVMLDKAPGSIVINYEASDANLVMSGEGKTITAKILLDGQPVPAEKRGRDVAEDGTIKVKDARLYNLIETGDSYENHTVTIEFNEAGVKAFAFTFG